MARKRYSPDRARARILTVDPTSRRVEGGLRDGGVVQVSVIETGPFFRWPKQDEVWTIFRRSDAWFLDRMLEPNENDKYIEEMSEGEAKIYADTIYTDSGNTLLHTGNTAASLLSDAVADGIADDSEIFQEAMATLEDNGGWFFIPPGRYLIGDIEIPSNVFVSGAGPATTLVQHPDAARVFTSEGSENTAIRDLTFDGNSPNVVGDVPVIQLDGASYSNLENLVIYDAARHAIQLTDACSYVDIGGIQVYKKNAAEACSDRGIYLDIGGPADPRSHHINIHDCIISDTGAACISFVADHIIIANNVLENSGDNGSNHGDGIAGYWNEQEHVLIYGNHIVNPSNNGIHTGGNNVSIIGNTIEAVANHGRGIVLWSDPNISPTPSDRGVIADNRMRDCVLDGIAVQNWTNLTVSGNVVEDTGQHGIYLVGCDETTVTGNTTKNPSSHGIVLIDSDDVDISSNIVMDSAVRGVVIAGTSQRTNISGNTVRGSGTSGMHWQNSAGNSLVSANTLTDNGTNFTRSTSDTTSTVIGLNFTDDSTSVASASTIAVPHGQPLVTITGTTTINSISAPFHKNHEVTLTFTGALTINDS